MLPKSWWNVALCSISPRSSLFVKVLLGSFSSQRVIALLWVSIDNTKKTLSEALYIIIITCLRGFWQSAIQTSLLNYRDQIENWNFARSKSRYNTFQKANNKGAGQTARMRRLVCACVVRKPPKTGFLATRPNYHKMQTCLYTALRVSIAFCLIAFLTAQHWQPPRKMSRHDWKIVDWMPNIKSNITYYFPPK